MSNDIPPASGIYKITCTANGKIYIGSSADLHDRRRKHFNMLRQNKHHSPYLQRAWNKYGEQCFTFEVLELVLPMSLTAREQYWLNKLSPFGRKGFNTTREAGSTVGYKYTPEQIEKTRRTKLGGREVGSKRLRVAYQDLSEQGEGGKVTVAALAMAAHVRKATAVEWLRNVEQSA